MHEIGLYFYYNAPTVQAVSAIMGLVVLVLYAIDTNRIRRASTLQTIASHRPFFILASRPEPGGVAYEIKNVGPGIALDTLWFFREPVFGRKPVRFGAIAPGSARTLLDGEDYVKKGELTIFEGIQITYTDTTGKEYWTDIICDEVQGSVHYQVETGEGPKVK